MLEVILVFWKALPRKTKYFHLPIIAICLIIIIKCLVYAFGG